MFEKMKGTTPDLTVNNIEKLKQLFPEIITDGRIDFDKLQLVLGEEIDDAPDRYNFTWHGKKETMKFAQQPSRGTLRPVKEKSKDWDTTENLYIEGDNLEVLKLLQKSYNNKVKMIYIDPPYNTGHDFVYKDDFKNSVDSYLELTGQKDNEGNKFTSNTESNGRYHTDWLNMMYPRLKLARNLLNENGAIFISINDNEHTNLIKLCNEVFGEKNFVANLVWANKEGGGSSDSKLFRIKHEYIVCFAKSIEKLEINGIDISNLDRYKSTDEYSLRRGPYYLQKLGMGSINYSKSLDYPIKAPDGTIIYPIDNNNGKKACWRWSQKKFNWGLENGFIVIQKDPKGTWTVYSKQYLKVDNEDQEIQRTQRPLGIINEYSSTQAAKYLDSIEMGSLFDYSKPVDLITYLIKRVAINKNDVVLDFFSGSATTAHATMDLNAEDGGNRKFIMVQLPEKLNEKTEDFKYNYSTICDIGEERIRRTGEKIKNELIERSNKENLFSENQLDSDNLDIGFKVFNLDTSNLNEWQADFDNIESNIDLFESNFVDGRSEEDVLYEIILKNGLDLTYQINEVITEGFKIYDVAFGNLFVCLNDKINRNVARKIVSLKNDYDIETSQVVFKDNGFENDTEKLNCYEILKDAGYQDSDLLSI